MTALRLLNRVLGTALAAVAGAAALSCSKTPAGSTIRGLSLSQTEATVDFDTTEYTLSVSSNQEWTLSITTDTGWLTADRKRGGVGETKIRFTITRNDGDRPRVGRVTLKGAKEAVPYLFTLNQNAENVLTGVNEWIHRMMSGWYYWNDAVKAAPHPDGWLAYDEFLNGLISQLPWGEVQDTSNGEDPPTIDGRFARDANGYLVRPLVRDHIYSYIERTPAGTRASESRAATFGFDFVPFYYDRGSTRYYMPLVTWVRDESPASAAGMRRGTWIAKYGGELIDEAALMKMIYQVGMMEGGYKMALTGEDGKTYDLTAVEMTVSPILRHEIISSTGGKKVAYLLYNGFERGDEIGGEEGGKWEFDEELNEVFAEFKAGGAQELVLDLRYNRGGYVSSCQLLSSLAGDVDDTMVFAKMKRNAGIRDFFQTEYGWRVANPEVVNFLEADEASALKLKKIYVLATEDSASASEMVINSLRGVGVEVVHIGTTTNGKNVGMDLVEPFDDEGEKQAIDGYNYEMWPITFKILNAKDFTNYAGGFEPTVRKDELDDLRENDTLFDLGDPVEILLKTALTMIDGEIPGIDPEPATRAALTRAGGTVVRPVAIPGDPRRGGAKYTREHPARPQVQ